MTTPVPPPIPADVLRRIVDTYNREHPTISRPEIAARLLHVEPELAALRERAVQELEAVRALLLQHQEVYSLRATVLGAVEHRIAALRAERPAAVQAEPSTSKPAAGVDLIAAAEALSDLFGTSDRDCWMPGYPEAVDRLRAAIAAAKAQQPAPPAAREAEIEAWQDSLDACRLSGVQTETGFPLYWLPPAVRDEAVRLMRSAPAPQATPEREAAEDAKLRELRAWVKDQRDAASDDYKGATTNDARAIYNTEIHTCTRLIGRIDALLSRTAPPPPAATDGLRAELERLHSWLLFNKRLPIGELAHEVIARILAGGKWEGDR